MLTTYLFLLFPASPSDSLRGTETLLKNPLVILYRISFETGIISLKVVGILDQGKVVEESFSPVSLRDGLSPRDGLSARRKTSPELLETQVKELQLPL